jgi:hypothetical protein
VLKVFRTISADCLQKKGFFDACSSEVRTAHGCVFVKAAGIVTTAFGDDQSTSCPAVGAALKFHGDWRGLWREGEGNSSDDAQVSEDELVEPAWDAPMPHKQICLGYNRTTNTVDNTRGGNHTSTTTEPCSRLTWVGLPKGEPPSTGWPVYFSFVTDAFNASDGFFAECSSPPIRFTEHLNPT